MSSIISPIHIDLLESVNADNDMIVVDGSRGSRHPVFDSRHYLRDRAASILAWICLAGICTPCYAQPSNDRAYSNARIRAGLHSVDSLWSLNRVNQGISILEELAREECTQ